MTKCTAELKRHAVHTGIANCCEKPYLSQRARARARSRARRDRRVGVTTGAYESTARVFCFAHVAMSFEAKPVKIGDALR
jgi:hypothetical protein